MQRAAQDRYYIKRWHTGDATRGDCCKLYGSRTEETSPSSFDGSIGEKGSALPAVAMTIVVAHNTRSDVGPGSRGIVTITARNTMAAPTTQPAEVRCRDVVELSVSFTAAVIAG
jgi:hypothetical protein